MTNKLYIIFGPYCLGQGELCFLLNHSPDIYKDDWGDGLDEWQINQIMDKGPMAGEKSILGTMYLHDDDYGINGQAVRLYTPMTRMKMELGQTDVFNLLRLARLNEGMAIYVQARNFTEVKKIIDESSSDNIVLVNTYMDTWSNGVLFFGMHEFSEIMQDPDHNEDYKNHRWRGYNRLISKYMDFLDFDKDRLDEATPLADINVPMSKWRDYKNLDKSLWEMFDLTPPSDEWIELYKKTLKEKIELDLDEVQKFNETIEKFISVDSYKEKIARAEP